MSQAEAKNYIILIGYPIGNNAIKLLFELKHIELKKSPISGGKKNRWHLPPQKVGHESEN
jgi:hypothetical protein